MGAVGGRLCLSGSAQGPDKNGGVDDWKYASSIAPLLYLGIVVLQQAQPVVSHVQEVSNRGRSRRCIGKGTVLARYAGFPRGARRCGQVIYFL